MNEYFKLTRYDLVFRSKEPRRYTQLLVSERSVKVATNHFSDCRHKGIANLRRFKTEKSDRSVGAVILRDPLHESRNSLFSVGVDRQAPEVRVYG